VTATPYYQFAEDAHISINKQHVVYLKNLHQMLIRHFITLVEENESKVLVSRQNDGSVNKAEDLQWEDDSEELTDEEIQKQIEMLESILSNEELDEESITVTGNKTIH
jgi:PHD/YefM family antitoxin component YafN of YafNO toxin-antitoxin module